MPLFRCSLVLLLLGFQVILLRLFETSAASRHPNTATRFYAVFTLVSCPLDVSIFERSPACDLYPVRPIYRQLDDPDSEHQSASRSFIRLGSRQCALHTRLSHGLDALSFHAVDNSESGTHSFDAYSFRTRWTQSEHLSTGRLFIRPSSGLRALKF